MDSRDDQAFMGPGADEFRDTALHPDKDLHGVPIENFLNAQCKNQCRDPNSAIADVAQTSAPSLLELPHKSSRSFSIPAAQISGYPAPNAAQLRAIFIRSMNHPNLLPSRKTAQNLRSDMDLVLLKASSPRMSCASET